MMDLADAASFFDDTEVTAPGSSTTLFYGQLVLFTNQLRDGLQIDRRILSYDTRQVFTMPEDGIVSFVGSNWALGIAQPDDFNGSVIRAGYIAHKLGDSADFGTAADFIAGTPRATLPASVIWMKNDRQANDTEEYWNEVAVYTGSGVQANDGEFVRSRGKLYFVRNTYFTSSGIRTLNSIELPADALKTITWVTQSGYDKVKQKPVPGASVDLPALVMRFYHDYRLVTHAAVKPANGDLVARVAQANDVTAGDSTLIDGITYHVVSRRAMPDATWWLHLTV